jgi:hypothetical protein
MIFLVSAAMTSFIADLARSVTSGILIEDMHSKKT